MEIIKKILNKLDITETGEYKNHFYIINIEDSDQYAKMYTKLSKKAINTENPGFEVNTNNTTTKITNYFELDLDGNTYMLFLIANFLDDKYYLKIDIGED